MLHKYRNNTKKTWYILNKVIRKQNDKSSLPETFKINNQNESNPQIISNEFNNFFSTIGSKYGDNIPDVPIDFKSYLHGNYPNSFFMVPTNPSDVILTANKIKSKTSVGHDNISTIIMQETIHDRPISILPVYSKVPRKTCVC